MNFLKKWGLRLSLAINPVQVQNVITQAALSQIFDAKETQKWIDHIEKAKVKKYGEMRTSGSETGETLP